MLTNANPKRTIKSDEKLLDIIEQLKESGGATISEVATEVGLAKSTTHSHLATLEHRGYVTNDDGKYKLSLLFLGIGYTIREELWFTETVEQSIQRLAEESGERTQFMIEEHGQGFFVFRAKGPNAVRVGPDIGEPRYLHESACGKAILAALPEERVDDIIDHWGLPAQTPQTITSSEQLKDELSAIREQEWSQNREESRSGLLGLGKSITYEGEVLGALSVSGPVQRLEDRQDELLNKLQGTANEIELNLTR